MLADRLHRRRFRPRAECRPGQSSVGKPPVSVLVIAVSIVVAVVAVVIVAMSAIVATLLAVTAVIRYQDAGRQRQHRRKHQNGEFHEWLH